MLLNFCLSRSQFLSAWTYYTGLPAIRSNESSRLFFAGLLDHIRCFPLPSGYLSVFIPFEFTVFAPQLTVLLGMCYTLLLPWLDISSHIFTSLTYWFT